MARNWEEWLKTASGPASPTEEAERDRTEKRIKDAIAQAADIPSSVRVYAKGSYANNTNVRRDSDVDIAVQWTEQAYVARVNEARGLEPPQLGYNPVSFGTTPAAFRASVERAMISAFGSSIVDTSGDKAIHVVRGQDSLDADVVPCFSLHRYYAPSDFRRGHRIFRRDTGYVEYIDNFPDQHLANGNAKNVATGRRYKEIVRCLKRLEGELVADRTLAKEYPGYIVECLLFNVPDDRFGHPRRFDDLDNALIWLWNTLEDPAKTNELVEVSRLEWLFQDRPDRSVPNGRDFVYKAWNRLHDNI